MTATALLGLQWGDEGKGKIVDLLAADADWVVRCQGGANAGHTVKVGSETTVLHLIPSGILAERAKCLIGHGVVLDPEQLFAEIERLEARGVPVAGRLLVSDRAHVVFPHHKSIDAAQEAGRAGAELGTTRRGIGPAYEDKVARRGLRVHDLLDPPALERKLGALQALPSHRPRDGDERPEETLTRFVELGRRLRPFVADSIEVLHQALSSGQRLFLEGAQGVLLDVDLGTYPYVTSSSTVVGGLLAGSGVPASAISRVVGVAKAYTTRVGSGPFPSELHDDCGDRLRDRGAEYGATTGRPRRCGWLDAVALRYAVRTNGADALALTKIDVLSGFDELKICIGYEIDGRETREFPADADRLGAVRPICRTLPGWSEDISAARDYHELPDNLRSYVAAVEALCGAPVMLLSVGPRREEIIERPLPTA